MHGVKRYVCLAAGLCLNHVPARQSFGHVKSNARSLTDFSQASLASRFQCCYQCPIYIGIHLKAYDGLWAHQSGSAEISLVGWF